MLTPKQIEALAEALVGGAQERMVNRILAQLVSTLAKGGELSVKDQRAVEAAAQMNREAVNRILIEERKHISSQTRSAIAALLLAADIDDVEILTRAHPGVSMAGMSSQFERIAQETAEGVARIIERDNLQMAYTAQQTWLRVATDAITDMNHGALTMDEVLARAVNELQSQGLTVIDYRSGVRNQVDVAVRLHVVTQTNQAAARMSLERMAQFGHDLVQTSAHFGARPTHAVWQGRVFSLTGAEGYENFYTVTDYGSVTGLCGANCRHTFGPYWAGITQLPQLPASIDGMTNQELYDATQTQRGYERAIRATKREIDALDKAGVSNTAARLKLGRQQAKLAAFIDKTKLPRQPLREKAYGIGKVQPRALRRAAA